MTISVEKPLTPYIAQGELAVGSHPDTYISAILGSCVAVCMWDPDSRVGGMNHILLPDSVSHDGGEFRFGAVEMERLINGIVKAGGDRKRLRAKIFGGASMLGGLSDIGHRNSEFAEEFLKREGIFHERGSVGGTQARRVRFWPYSGKAQQRVVSADHALPPPKPPKANGVELF